MNIDTLSTARELRAAKPPSDQAEAIAAAIGRAVAESSATKGDLDLARAGLKSDIEQVRASLEIKVEQVRAGVKGYIEQVRAELGEFRKEVTSIEHKLEAKIESAQTKLIMWFVGTQLAFVALIGAIFKL